MEYKNTDETFDRQKADSVLILVLMEYKNTVQRRFDNEDAQLS